MEGRVEGDIRYGGVSVWVVSLGREGETSPPGLGSLGMFEH